MAKVFYGSTKAEIIYKRTLICALGYVDDHDARTTPDGKVAGFNSLATEGTDGRIYTRTLNAVQKELDNDRAHLEKKVSRGWTTVEKAARKAAAFNIIQATIDNERRALETIKEFLR